MAGAQTLLADFIEMGEEFTSGDIMMKDLQLSET
jgi:hypothetical protein